MGFLIADVHEKCVPSVAMFRRGANTNGVHNVGRLEVWTGNTFSLVDLISLIRCCSQLSPYWILQSILGKRGQGHSWWTATALFDQLSVLRLSVSCFYCLRPILTYHLYNVLYMLGLESLYAVHSLEALFFKVKLFQSLCVFLCWN